MNKKAIKYLGLILAISVMMPQRPSAAEDSSGTATPATAERQAMDAGEIDTQGERARDGLVQVVMPTNTEHVFDFIMDPQELIATTDAAAYDGSRFEEDATVFFRRLDGGAEMDYSSSSDALTILNKGEEDVRVTLVASISPDSLAGITMSDDPGFPDNTEASLYLALTDGEFTVPVGSGRDAVIEGVIPGVLEGEAPNEYSFRIVGAANKAGDWSEVTEAAPKITVTWTVAMDEDETFYEIEWDGKDKLSGERKMVGPGERNLTGDLNEIGENHMPQGNDLTGDKPDMESDTAAGQGPGEPENVRREIRQLQ